MTSTICTDETVTNWSLYVTGNLSNIRVGRAPPVSFSSDLIFLRIGSAIFQQSQDGNYGLFLQSLQSFQPYPTYIEEFASSRGFTVLANRQNILPTGLYNIGLDDLKVANVGNDFLSMEERVSMGNYDNFVDENDSEESSQSSYGDRPDESMSERSTEESDSELDDDLITPWTRLPDDYDGSGTDTSSTSEFDVEESKAENQDGSDSDEAFVPLSRVFRYGEYVQDTDSEDGWDVHRLMTRDSDVSGESSSESAAEPPKTRQPTATLLVLDGNSETPRRIFKFKYPVRFPLYDSPPVIHGCHSLLVWPVSGGEVLFADFTSGTYFTRRLRSSTSSSEYEHIVFK